MGLLGRHGTTTTTKEFSGFGAQRSLWMSNHTAHADTGKELGFRPVSCEDTEGFGAGQWQDPICIFEISLLLLSRD